MLAGAHGFLNGIGHFRQAGNAVRVQPVALQRRAQKYTRRLGRADAARDERRGDEARQTQLALKQGDRSRVGRADVELR